AYELFAYAFSQEPSQELLALLKEARSSLESLAREDMPVDGEENLKQEYYDRFFVPKSKLYVPPFEAVIRTGLLDSPHTLHVKACYDMVEFNPHESNIYEALKYIIYPDHIAFELIFMTYLCRSEQ